jgi:hypothetical protein
LVRDDSSRCRHNFLSGGIMPAGVGHFVEHYKLAKSGVTLGTVASEMAMLRQLSSVRRTTTPARPIPSRLATLGWCGSGANLPHEITHFGPWLVGSTETRPPGNNHRVHWPIPSS